MQPINLALSSEEIKRLENGLRAAWSDPFIEDIGDFVWEALFHYVKGLNIPDPLTSWSRAKSLQENTSRKSKLLFDAIDTKSKIGWSLKALQTNNLAPNARIEFVIQRANIFAKHVQLGFTEKLSNISSTEDLGKALIKHWNDKVINDMRSQFVEDGRLAVLLKSLNRREYVFLEQPIPIFKIEDFIWQWSNERAVGLQAKSKITGQTILKWYHGQAQLFQSVTIPVNAARLTINPNRINVDLFVANMLNSDNLK